MTRRLTALLMGGAFACALPVLADDAAVTVKKEDVKTWTTTVGDKEYAVRPATPTFDGDTGLFRLSAAYTLQKGKGSVALYWDNVDRDPRGLDLGVWGISGGYGVTDNLEFFAQIGVQQRTKSNRIDELGFYNDVPFAPTGTYSRFQTGFGDVRAGLKLNILDDCKNDPVGLAVKAMVKIPTADETKGLGTGKVSFAGDLILSKSFSGKADIHGNIGYEINSDPDGRDIGNAVRWGVGLQAPANKIFAIQAELAGRVFSNADFDQTNPLDLTIGPVVWFAHGVFIQPGFTYALAYDGGTNDVSAAKRTGGHVAVGYHPGVPCCEIYVPPPPPPPPVNRPPTVSLDCVRDTLLQGETTPCKAMAADPDGDPLTYSWSASAGRAAGPAADATYDSAGVPCETNVAVTVDVADGRGGTAQATDTVKVRCPEAPKPEAVTCTSAGFPRNLSRLNNVDKACLDDVASKLRGDARSRVVITGYADKGERNAEVTGRRRAEAVKAYLVKERGVDAARITTRSAGAAMPVDTGAAASARAKNRRVDVTFVPEGATAPELQ